MQKIFILLGSMFMLVGCVESVAVMSTGAANGKIIQSSINTGISYGIKAQTGKTPMGHVLSYNQKQNLKAKQDSCSSFTNKKNSNICSKGKERIASNQVKIKKLKSVNQFTKTFSSTLRSSIDEKFKIKYLD